MHDLELILLTEFNTVYFWIFFVKIDIFSETISTGRTHFAIWGIKHYLTLLVKSIQDHGWINFQTSWDTWGNFSKIYVGSL